MEDEEIINIPENAIFIKGRIYIPYTEDNVEIPKNSIIYHNQIYTEFTQDKTGEKDKILNKKKVQNKSNNKIIKSHSITDIKEVTNENKNYQKKDIKNKERKSLSTETKTVNEKKQAKLNIEEDNFLKYNKYYYNLEDKNIMKYSINRANRSRKNNKLTTISFNCFDSYCMGRANAHVIYKKFENREILYLENFIIKTKHSLTYEQHIYIIEQKVKKDIEENKINKEDLKNIIYARAYFIDTIKKNPNTQLIKIETDFIKKFT